MEFFQRADWQEVSEAERSALHSPPALTLRQFPSKRTTFGKPCIPLPQMELGSGEGKKKVSLNRERWINRKNPEAVPPFINLPRVSLPSVYSKQITAFKRAPGGSVEAQRGLDVADGDGKLTSWHFASIGD